MFNFLLEEIPSQILTEKTTTFAFESIAVFGGGSRGDCAIATLQAHNIQVTVVMDNDERKHGTMTRGVKVVGPDSLEGRKQKILVASTYEHEIFVQLLGLGFSNADIYFFKPERDACVSEDISPYIKNIFAVYARLADEESRVMYSQAVKIAAYRYCGPTKCSKYIQYDHPDVCVTPGDVVLDIGGMHGETAVLFANKVSLNCKVFTFEPSPIHNKTICEAIKGYGDAIELVPLGAWSQATTLKFNADFPESIPGAHCVDPNGKEEIRVTDIDTFVNERCGRLDLIKMDIEGAELEALQGARQTIARFSPKLQISIYHKASHLWEVLELIDSINKDYVYYVGHHSTMHTETILYARPR